MQSVFLEYSSIHITIFKQNGHISRDEDKLSPTYPEPNRAYKDSIPTNTLKTSEDHKSVSDCTICTRADAISKIKTLEMELT